MVFFKALGCVVSGYDAETSFEIQPRIYHKTMVKQYNNMILQYKFNWCGNFDLITGIFFDTLAAVKSLAWNHYSKTR